MPTKLTETDVFVLLSNRRRRMMLRLLQENTTPLTVRELAELVGSYEYGESSPEDVRDICVSLYHVHLPKLERADVIEHDPAEETVNPGLNFGVLRDALERVGDEDNSWA